MIFFFVPLFQAECCAAPRPPASPKGITLEESQRQAVQLLQREAPAPLRAQRRCRLLPTGLRLAQAAGARSVPPRSRIPVAGPRFAGRRLGVGTERQPVHRHLQPLGAQSRRHPPAPLRRPRPDFPFPPTRNFRSRPARARLRPRPLPDGRSKPRPLALGASRSAGLGICWRAAGGWLSASPSVPSGNAAQSRHEKCAGPLFLRSCSCSELVGDRQAVFAITHWGVRPQRCPGAALPFGAPPLRSLISAELVIKSLVQRALKPSDERQEMWKLYLKHFQSVFLESADVTRGPVQYKRARIEAESRSDDS